MTVRSCKYRSFVLTCVIALLGLVLGVSSTFAEEFDASSTNQAKVVTVGYYSSKHFQEGMADSSIKSGYGYEYLQQVSDYTGWQYKYIYGDWGAIFDMFLKGEVDIMAGLAKMDERKGQMEYPDYYMDVDYHFIFTKRGDNSMSEEDISSFNGKRIGCLRNSNLTTGLKKWAAEKGAQLEYVYFNDLNELPRALERGEVDGFAGSDKFLDRGMNVKPLVLVASPKSYICVRKGANRLLRELNTALEHINSDDGAFIESLRNKYYRSKSVSAELSSREQEWLEKHNVLKVAYAPDHLPYCTRGADGRVNGVLKDIMDSWLKKLNLDGKLMVRYVPCVNFRQAITELQSGSVDVVFPLPSNRWYAEQSNVMISSELVSVPMSVVFKGDYNKSIFKKIAMIAKPQQTLFMREMFPGSEWLMLDNAEECMRAVQDGKASSALLITFKANPLMRDAEFSQLKFMPIGKGSFYSVGVRKGNFALLSLLNRGFSLMDMNVMNNAAYKYMEYHSHYSMSDFIRDNLIFFVLLMAMITFVIITILALYVSGMKKAHHATQIQVEISEALSLDYPYAILVDIERGFSLTIKKDGKVLKEKDWIYQESYDAAWKLFANKYVCEEDRSEVLRASSLDVVLENLKEQSEYICTYRAEWGNKKHYTQSSFTKVYFSNLKKNVIILGCKTVDDLMAKEREHRELLSNALAVAERSNQSKTIFLNNMSHDIRTPMNAIIGFTNLAKIHVRDTDAVRSYLNKISISSSHLLSLINNVLDMSRIESGKVKLSEDRVHLPSMIREIQDMVQNTAQSKGVSISFYDALTNEVVLADDLKLKQVILNIVGNSIKFTRPGGRVVVSVVERGVAPEGFANYQFIVADTGIGMSADFRNHIFETFSRERTSTVSGIQGTGLGMAISKNIIDMMGGTIVVDSTPNVGTKITVNVMFKFSDLVIKNASAKELGIDPTEELFKSNAFDFKGKKILLVEDNPLNQEIAMSILEELGFEVDLAEDGLAAVEKIRQNPAGTYNAVLMDIQMPNMDGYEATRTIRKMTDSAKALIPVVAVTANAFDEDRQKAFDAGMNGHVSKPISVPELMEVLGKQV
ncbi:extracellular solute-binding protein, family 3 [Fibrobacter sp. UWH5]|nr:extracellular solute-binding protein, family 3 [Fibrobacter sp. UWH5]